ncbi:MAG: helix-turn-helix domain-containing protein [Akkermansiaceae bacterium]
MRGSLSGADVLEYGKAMGSSWDASFVLLSAGHLNAGIEFLAGEDFLLYRESWAQRFHNVGVLRPGMIGLGISEQTGTDDARWWGRPLSANRLPIARSGQELDLITSPGETVTGLEMAEGEFRRIFHRLTGLEADPYLIDGRFIAVPADAIARLLDFWNSVLDVTNGDAPTNFGKVDLVAGLVSAMKLPETGSRTRPGKVSQIEGIMSEAARSGFRVTVPDLSVRLGISRRTIEYAFREYLGISPQAYFNLRRLNVCRLDLAKADPECNTVTDIVVRRGFHQLGRFATIYQDHFGELPSETLRKPTGSAPAAIRMRRFPEKR